MEEAEEAKEGEEGEAAITQITKELTWPLLNMSFTVADNVSFKGMFVSRDETMIVLSDETM